MSQSRFRRAGSPCARPLHGAGACRHPPPLGQHPRNLCRPRRLRKPPANAALPEVQARHALDGEGTGTGGRESAAPRIENQVTSLNPVFRRVPVPVPCFFVRMWQRRGLPRGRAGPSVRNGGIFQKKLQKDEIKIRHAATVLKKIILLYSDGHVYL